MCHAENGADEDLPSQRPSGHGPGNPGGGPTINTLESTWKQN